MTAASERGRLRSKVPTTITFNPGFYLWVCPNYPQSSESYLNNSANHCVIKGFNNDTIRVSSATTTYTLYVPPGGAGSGTGAHGAGYWIACAQWFSDGPGGGSNTHTTFSGIWYGSG